MRVFDVSFSVGYSFGAHVSQDLFGLFDLLCFLDQPMDCRGQTSEQVVVVFATGLVLVGCGNEIPHHHRLCLNLGHELCFGIIEGGFKSQL